MDDLIPLRLTATTHLEGCFVCQICKQVDQNSKKNIRRENPSWHQINWSTTFGSQKTMGKMGKMDETWNFQTILESQQFPHLPRLHLPDLLFIWLSQTTSFLHHRECQGRSTPTPYIGDGGHPTILVGKPQKLGFFNPYYWVDEFIPY